MVYYKKTWFHEFFCKRKYKLKHNEIIFSNEYFKKTIQLLGDEFKKTENVLNKIKKKNPELLRKIRNEEITDNKIIFENYLKLTN